MYFDRSADAKLPHQRVGGGRGAHVCRGMKTELHCNCVIRCVLASRYWKLAPLDRCDEHVVLG